MTPIESSADARVMQSLVAAEQPEERAARPGACPSCAGLAGRYLQAGKASSTSPGES